MPGFDSGNTVDYVNSNWWTTVSGAGTASAAVDSWADDYTRHRSGGLRPTYTSVDNVIGRKESIQDVNP